MSFESHAWFFLRQLRSPVPYFKDLFYPNSAGTLVPDSRLQLKSVPSFDIGRDKVLGCLKLWNSEKYCWPVEDVFQLKEQDYFGVNGPNIDGDYRDRFRGYKSAVKYKVGPQIVADHTLWSSIHGLESWGAPQSTAGGQQFMEILHTRFKYPHNYRDSSGSTAATLEYYNKRKPFWYTYSMADSSPLKLSDSRWVCRAYSIFGSSVCTVITSGDAGAAVVTPMSIQNLWWSGNIYETPLAQLQSFQDSTKCQAPGTSKLMLLSSPVRVYQWDVLDDPPGNSRAAPTNHEYAMTTQGRNAGSVGTFGETIGATPLRFFPNGRPDGYHLISTASLTLDITAKAVSGNTVTFTVSTSDLTKVSADLTYAQTNKLPILVEVTRTETLGSTQVTPFKPLGTVVRVYVSGANSISVEFSSAPSMPATAIQKLNINIDTSTKSILRPVAGALNTTYEYPLCQPSTRPAYGGTSVQEWDYPPQTDSSHSGARVIRDITHAVPQGCYSRYSYTQCCGVIENSPGTETIQSISGQWASKRYIGGSSAGTTFTLVSTDGSVLSFNGPFGNIYLPASKDWDFTPGLYFTTKTLVSFLEHHPKGDDLIRWIGAEKMFRPLVCHLDDGRIAVYDNISASLSNGLTAAALMAVFKPYSLYFRRPHPKKTIESLLNGWIHRSGKTNWVEQRSNPSIRVDPDREAAISWMSSGAPFPAYVRTLESYAASNQCETRFSHRYEDPDNNKMPAIDGWYCPRSYYTNDLSHWSMGSYQPGYLAESVGNVNYGLFVSSALITMAAGAGGISEFVGPAYTFTPMWAYNYNGDLNGTIVYSPVPGVIHGQSLMQAAIQENMLPGNVCSAHVIDSYTIKGPEDCVIHDYYYMDVLAAVDGAGVFFKQRGWTSASDPVVNSILPDRRAQGDLPAWACLYAGSIEASVGEFNIPGVVKQARWSNPSSIAVSKLGTTWSPNGCGCIENPNVAFNGAAFLTTVGYECFCTSGCNPSQWSPVYTEKFKAPANAGADRYGNLYKMRNRTKSGIWESGLGQSFKINLLRSFGALGMVLSYGTTPIKFTQTRFRYDEAYPWNNTWNRTDPRDTVSEENCYVVLLGAGARVVHAGGELSQWFNENPEVGVLYKDVYTPKQEGWDRITIIDRANGIPVCLSILVLRPDCLPGGDMAWGGSGPQPRVVSSLSGHAMTFSLLSSVFYRAPADVESTLCGPLGYDDLYNANAVNLSTLSAYPRLRVRFLGTMKFSVSGSAFVLSPDAPSTGVAGTGFGPVEGSDDWDVQVLQSFNATSTDFSELRPVASKAMKLSGSGWVLDFSEAGSTDLISGRRIGFRIYHKRTGLFQLLDSQRTTGLTGTAKYAVQPATNKGFSPIMTRPAAPTPLVAPSYPTNTNPAA